ncbi:hypothetical protein LEMLEM_LOCUS16883 [Lemmus lemmus]
MLLTGMLTSSQQAALLPAVMTMD